MTLKEAKNELSKKENDLELSLTLKKINFYKTQPKSVKLNVINVMGGQAFDKFSHYVIKDEKYDKEIYLIQEEINALQLFIIKEMKRISNCGGSELIVYLRDEEKTNWEEISKITNYSIRQCHRLYKEAKK